MTQLHRARRVVRVSAKAETFTESVIREMTRLAAKHGAVNLAQGFPDFSCPPELKEAAKAAIDADVNQYAITWGAAGVSGQAIAAKVESHLSRDGGSTPRPKCVSLAGPPKQ